MLSKAYSCNRICVKYSGSGILNILEMRMHTFYIQRLVFFRRYLQGQSSCCEQSVPYLHRCYSIPHWNVLVLLQLQQSKCY